eukprot:7455683-Alexandrium_andersonii.AAC.1
MVCRLQLGRRAWMCCWSAPACVAAPSAAACHGLPVACHPPAACCQCWATWCLRPVLPSALAAPCQVAAPSPFLHRPAACNNHLRTWTPP